MKRFFRFLRRLWRPELFLAGLGGALLALGALWSWNRLVPGWQIPWFGVNAPVTFTDHELTPAWRRVQGAAAALDGFLGSGTRGQGWRDYLRWEDLNRQAALSHGQADQQLLTEVLALLSQDEEGLDLPQFANLRSALSTYLKMLSLAETPPEPPAEDGAPKEA